jgi:uncharacterized protein
MVTNLVSAVVVRCAVWLIELYQARCPSHWRGRCLFTPTCSCYAKQCIKEYGLRDGVFLAVKRLARCTPPNGGIDPIPEVVATRSWNRRWRS